MELGRTPYWLTFLGAPGVGKTCLARQLLEQAKLNNPGRHALWVSGTGIHREENRRPNCVWFTQAAFGDRMKGGEYDLPEYLRADYFVALDDLGAARDKTDFVSDGLFRLADNRAHRWMVWTSNLSLADVSAKLDARLSSRLIRDDNRLVTISAPDYALRTKGVS